MNRLLAACLMLASTGALAQAESAPPADPSTALESPLRLAPEPAADPPAPQAADPDALDREQLKREVLDEVRRSMEREREEIRAEIRAEIMTQAAHRELAEGFQLIEEPRRLELFTLDGYLRLRPELFYKLDLDRGADPNGFSLFPSPAIGGARTLASANMRWRLEPTLNVSEDLRIRSQIDLFDNLVLGSTPMGLYGNTDYAPIPTLSNSMVEPQGGRSWIRDAIHVRRVYGEVTTPVGQFLFGRMGSHWGLGMLTNSGNCLDCDYGDTVDRIMFVSAKVAGFYIVPMLDFVSEGPTSVATNEYFGQPFDRDNLDDARDYGIAIAKRDTDLEITRKLGAGQHVLNYGLYFTYRTQRFDSAWTAGGTQTPFADLGTYSYVPRGASIYTPDFWIRFQTPRLRLELEVAAVLGTVDTMTGAPGAGSATDPNQAVSIEQYGAVAQSEYAATDSFDIGLEIGYASGDPAPGMGNYPGRGRAAGAGGANLLPVAGSIEGPQFCLDTGCSRRDTTIGNFRFNRDYRVDLILWREIFRGVTDAVYLKPGFKYELTDGLSLWANVIYSRAIEATSTPSGTHADLGLEIDAGLRYETSDGFYAGIAYGVLFALPGLDNVAARLDAGTAQTVRGWFAIRY